VGASGEAGCATGINGDQNNQTCRGAGAVYVYTRTAEGWRQQAYVKASNTGNDDSFGSTIALHGDTLAVSAFQEDSCAIGIDGNQRDEGCSGAGAVYIFARTNTVWQQTAYLKQTQAAQGHSFGNSLAFDGSTLAVGVSDRSCASGFNPAPGFTECPLAGAVYLFSRTATSWTQQAYVKATNTAAFDWFGSAVAIENDTLVVGAPGEDSCATGINGDQRNNGCGAFEDQHVGAGAVYVYVMQ
jgi:hypothetical protein